MSELIKNYKMKKFNIKNLKAELLELGASQFDIEAICNNASLYNDLVTAYKKNETHNMYLMYQLNGMILKQKNDLKKINKKIGDGEAEDQAFQQMLEAVKQSKNNKKTEEQR